MSRAIPDLRSVSLDVSAILEKKKVPMVKPQQGGSTHVIGITGPLGVGKSTLIAGLAKRFAASGESVAILLNDPSSRQGGSFLGDRVRMQDLSGLPGVFIRSIPSGASGGISLLTYRLVSYLVGKGFDRVIVETTGAGQSETAVSYIADTTLLVLIPSLGDEIQALKSGLSEVADLVVVNKADRLEPDRAIAEIELSLAMKDRSWKVPSLKVSALKGEGMDDLMEALEEHRSFFQEHKEELVRDKTKALLSYMVGELGAEKVRGLVLEDIEAGAEAIAKGEVDIEAFLDKVVSGICLR